MKIEVNQCICVDVHTDIFAIFYGIPVLILTVFRFAGIKFFAQYRYRYDKNMYLLFDFSAVYRPALD